jgi:hypothetical protein
VDIQINPGTTVRILSAAALGMAVLHLIGCIPFFFMERPFPLAPLNLDAEQNLPTQFSAILLGLCALLTGLIAWSARSRGQEKPLPWWGLAIAFLLIGLDETTAIHERFTAPLQLMFDTRGMLRFAWVIPYGLLTLVFAAVYARFLIRLPADTRKFVLTGAVLYVGGTIGWELIGSAWIDTYGRDTVYYLLVMVEEFLEMAGCIVFIYAFMNHIRRYLPGLSLRIASD